MYYQSGTGTAVSLAMSTIHHTRTFDLNLAFPKDHKYYFDPKVGQRERDAKAFPCFAGSSDYTSLILASPVRPLTMAQGHVAWFIFRLYSLTSSTVDRMARARASEIFPAHEKRRAYEIVFEHLGLERLLPAEEEEEADSSVEGDGSLEDESSDDNNVRNDESSDQGSVDRSPAGIAKGVIDAFKFDPDEAKIWFLESRFPSLNEEECKALCNLLQGGERIAKMQIASIRKKLQGWAHEAKDHRAFYFMTNPQLKDAVKELLGPARGERARASGPMPSRRPELLEKLVQLTKAANERRANGEDDDDSIDPPDLLLLQVFKASHMKPISGAKAKAYCRQGHENERPFMEELLKHSQEGLTGPIKIRGIHGAPLVEMRRGKAVKDSADGIATYYEQEDEEASEQSDDEGDYETKILPIEVKSRIASSTFFRERHNLESALGAAAWENGEPVYAHIDAEDRKLHEWIPKESENFQLLHHVVAYDSDKGLILVGNNKKVMFGVFVTYSKRIKEAYAEILEDLYTQALLAGPMDPSTRSPWKKLRKFSSQKISQGCGCQSTLSLPLSTFGGRLQLIATEGMITFAFHSHLATVSSRTIIPSGIMLKVAVTQLPGSFGISSPFRAFRHRKAASLAECFSSLLLHCTG